MPKLISVNDLFRRAWALYQEKFSVLVGVMVIPFLLLSINPLLVQLGADQNLFLPVALVIIVLACFCTLWAGVSAILVLSHPTGSLTVKGAYKLSWGKILSLLWVAIIVSFVVLGGFFLFIIPGLILSIFFLFAQLIVVLENEKGMKSLIKSREYGRGYFWPIVGRYFVLMVASMFVYGVLTFIGSLVDSLIVTTLLQMLANILVTPFILAYIYILYNNLKETKGDALSNQTKKSGLNYLLIGIAGYVFVLLITVVLILMATSAWGGYLIGSTVTDIFNDQVMLKSTQ